ncbi:hypothetical protein PO250_00405 [Limosilactobacillus mucosae]|uniref:Uncharacterized protein n=1 Tax=Limosilactobacillus mucosae TaxID=97478 RepID=A0AAJ1HQF1_LIMMU|nr:hypothetical protein [Limosilactobacillus mucosae]MDC2828818.1 hypothetical protein [Limosilactobacillus mucosae]
MAATVDCVISNQSLTSIGSSTVKMVGSITDQVRTQLPSWFWPNWLHNPSRSVLSRLKLVHQKNCSRQAAAVFI